MQREPRLLRLSWPNSDAGLSERKDWQGQSIAVRERCWYFGNTLSCMELRTGLEKEWGLHSRGFVAGRKKWNLYLGSGLPDHLGIHIETILQIPSINGSINQWEDKIFSSNELRELRAALKPVEIWVFVMLQSRKRIWDFHATIGNGFRAIFKVQNQKYKAQ